MKKIILGSLLVITSCAHIEGPSRTVHFPYAHDLVHKAQNHKFQMIKDVKKTYLLTNYVSEASKMRSLYIKNKMVER